MNLRFPHVWVFAVALATGSPALPVAADEVWKPYLENKKGEAKDLGDPKGLNDKDWLSVHYTGYSGYRPALGVVAGEEETAYPAGYKNQFAKMFVALSGKAKQVVRPQNHIEDLVRQALMSTNRFTLVERSTATGDIIAEQDSAAGSRVDSATVARIGNIKGAEYTVKATIIELNPEKETNEVKVAGGAGKDAKDTKGAKGGFGDLGVKTRIAFCRLNVRVVRTETSEIIAEQTVDGSCLTTSLTGVAGVGLRMLGGIGGKSKKEPPISDAMQTCANKAVYYVVTTLEATPWQGTVASVSDSLLTINGGTNVGLTEGMTLTLLSKGEDVVDPETNEVVGAESSEIGQVRVVSTQDQFATCQIIQGGTGAKTGDFVRRENPKK